MDPKEKAAGVPTSFLGLWEVSQAAPSYVLKLEAGPSGSSFEHTQLGHLQGENGRWAFLPVPSAVSSCGEQPWCVLLGHQELLVCTAGGFQSCIFCRVITWVGVLIAGAPDWSLNPLLFREKVGNWGFSFYCRALLWGGV